MSAAEPKDLGTLIVVVGKAVSTHSRLGGRHPKRATTPVPAWRSATALCPTNALTLAQSPEQVAVRQARPILHDHCSAREAEDEADQARWSAPRVGRGAPIHYQRGPRRHSRVDPEEQHLQVEAR